MCGSTAGGGYYLWNDTADKLSIMAYYDPTHFKPGDSDSHALRQLDKRKSSLMAGLSYVHNTQYGFLRTALAGDTWITAMALSGIWPGSTVTPTVV